jgi:hypothetical protein
MLILAQPLFDVLEYLKCKALKFKLKECTEVHD